MKTTTTAITTLRGKLVFPVILTLASACNHGGENAPSAGPAVASAPPPSASAQETPTPAAAASSQPAHAEEGGHGDPTNALLGAAHDLQLTDSQKSTIHALEEQLEANEKDTGASFHALHAELVTDTKAGAIDAVKLRAGEVASDKALQVHIAKEAETLNGLHAALVPAQRKAVVAAVRAKQPVHDRDRMGAGAPQGTSAQDRAKKHLDRMTQELGLDASQQQRVAVLLADQPAPGAPQPQDDRRRKRIEVLLTAFEQDAFDAKTAVPATPAMATARHEEMDHQIAFLSKLLPILRPDQREKLAAHMEKGGMGGGHHDDDDDKAK